MDEEGNKDSVDPVAQATEPDDALRSPTVGQTPDVQVNLNANMMENTNSNMQGTTGSSTNQDDVIVDDNSESQDTEENKKDDEETEDC